MSTDNSFVNVPLLPGELWDQIVDEMEPFDVLALSMTCRTQHSRLSSRESWIRVLRGVCRRSGTFFRSFDIDKMDTPAIQRAATRHERWMALVHKHAVSFEGLATVSRLSPRNMEKSMVYPRALADSHLVPGGPYMLVAAFQTAPNGFEPRGPSLRVWDLGVPGDSTSEEPHVVASHAFNSGDLQPDPLGVTSTIFILDESALLMLVVFPAWTGGLPRRFAHVLHIQFGDTTPSITHMSSITLTLHRRPMQVALCEDRAVFLLDDVILVWDIREERYCKWTLDCTDLPQSQMAHVTSEFVLVIKAAGIFLWDIPGMTWTDVISSHPVNIAHGNAMVPNDSLQKPWSNRQQNIYFFSRAGSLTDGNTFVVDVMSNSGDTSIVRYELAISPSEHAGPSQSKERLALTVSSVAILPGLNSTASLALDMPSYFLTPPSTTPASICTGMDHRHSALGSYVYVPINVQALTPGEVRAVTDQSGSIDLGMGDTRFVPLALYHAIASCPLSGRIVYTTLDTVGARRAYILDYVV